MEQYKEQYRKETVQVHAPIELIEKTKAAVRVEEERILRERAAQSRIRRPEMTEPRVTYADYAKYGKTSSLRKWTYPLTAAAALLILLSVSLTMRGLKSGNMAPAADTADSGSAENGEVYEGAEDLDTGFAESTAEATVEMAEEESSVPQQAAGAAESESAAAEAPAAEAPAADMAPALNEAQKSMNTMDDEVQRSPVETEESETRRKDAMSKQEEAAEENLADMAAGKNGITVEKVEKKPAFCDLPDVKTYVYDEETFMVRKEKAGWVAYVETENETGYLFRGEMEDVEEFLEAISQSLAEL